MKVDRQGAGFEGESSGAGPPDVSIAIVHYQTPEILRASLALLLASRDADRFEVFVVDNASDAFDAAAIRDAFPAVTVIENEENRGFAVASNQALRRATGRYLLLLNPDAFVERDTIAVMRDYLDEHPDVGCATCRVELEDGRLDLACRRMFPTPERSLYRMTLLSRLFPRSRRFGQYNLTYLDERLETEIDQPCGAFMMVRAEVAGQVGLLDERYFMYGEDTDWAYRIKRAGWRIMYVPRTKVRHLKRASSRMYRSRTIRYFYDAMRIFYRTHYAAIYPRWMTAVVLSAIGARERIELTANAVRSLRGRS
jgi:N-acetylglucosaminyl-diphospho-decaprenol L-rhamnosyltransferase